MILYSGTEWRICVNYIQVLLGLFINTLCLILLGPDGFIVMLSIVLAMIWFRSSISRGSIGILMNGIYVVIAVVGSLLGMRMIFFLSLPVIMIAILTIIGYSVTLLIENICKTLNIHQK